MKNFRQPSKYFVRRQFLENIKATLHNKQIFILHLWGLPGSGKSDIVLSLAQKFPFNGNTSIFVKHQIECSDEKESIVDSLKNLLDVMHEHRLLKRDERWKMACSNLEQNRFSYFLDLLVSSHVPILLIIEDPQDEPKELLEDLMRAVDHLHCKEFFHVYITSNPRNICETAQLERYEQYEVQGLTQSESFELLGVIQSESDEVEAANIITERLSGLPLGLIAVKASCQKSKTNLSTYKDWLENLPLETQRMEIKALGVKHIFPCIIRLLHWKYSNLWKIMHILAMFHHGAIPQDLIGKIQQFQRNFSNERVDETVMYNQRDSGNFITEVENLGICRVDSDRNLGVKILFHQVVFRAIRHHLEQEDLIVDAIREALYAISALVHRDLRKMSNYNFMKCMQPHISRVLEFVDTHPDVCSDFVTNMVVAHLYEVLGVISQPITPAEDMFMKSIEKISDEVQRIASMQTGIFSFINNSSAEEPRIYAEKLAKILENAGVHLQSKDSNDYDRYVSLVMQFKEKEKDFLLSLDPNKQIAAYLKKICNIPRMGLSPEKLKLFRDLGSEIIFLKKESHCKAFFFERMVSVLYSLGRIVITAPMSIDIEQRKKFVQISDVAHALCQECLQRTGVRLLFLRRGVEAKVAVRLKGIRALGPSRKEVLLQARPEMEKLIDEIRTPDPNHIYFENGLRREMDTSFEEMTYLRYVVRVDMKLIPLSSTEERNERKEKADEYYHQLCKVVNENRDWQLSSKCLIYCGKYLAAIGQFKEAAEHFRQALSDEAIQNDKALLYPWACCNYARAVVAAEDMDVIDDAIEKCRDAIMFEDKIIEELLVKLQKRYDKLLEAQEEIVAKQTSATLQ